jgi:hypothetical protein
MWWGAIGEKGTLDLEHFLFDLGKGRGRIASFILHGLYSFSLRRRTTKQHPTNTAPIKNLAASKEALQRKV